MLHRSHIGRIGLAGLANAPAGMMRNYPGSHRVSGHQGEPCAQGVGMGSVGQNLRYALRQLGRNPGFTLTVIFTLALAIGANTAIFSIVNALLLKSLPYAHPERM